MILNWIVEKTQLTNSLSSISTKFPSFSPFFSLCCFNRSTVSGRKFSSQKIQLTILLYFLITCSLLPFVIPPGCLVDGTHEGGNGNTNASSSNEHQFLMMGGMKDRPAPPPHMKNFNLAAGNYFYFAFHTFYAFFIDIYTLYSIFSLSHPPALICGAKWRFLIFHHERVNCQLK